MTVDTAIIHDTTTVRIIPEGNEYSGVMEARHVRTDDGEWRQTDVARLVSGYRFRIEPEGVWRISDGHRLLYPWHRVQWVGITRTFPTTEEA